MNTGKPPNQVTTQWRNSATRYGAPAIALHWLTLLLLAAVFACAELREFFPKDSDPRALLETWHFMLGLSVLGLVALRLAVHLSNPIPRIEPAPPRWQEASARALHWALYGLMVAMPLAGWLIVSAKGKTVAFFGFVLPALIAGNEGIAELFEDLHEAGGTLLYVLVGLHAAAALYHHYFVRDDTLRRMLPRHA